MNGFHILIDPSKKGQDFIKVSTIGGNEMERNVREYWEQVKYNSNALGRMLEARGVDTTELSASEIIDFAHDALCIDEYHFDLHYANCVVCNKPTN